MKNLKLFITLIICLSTFKSIASTVYEIDNAIYLECNFCYTTTDFKNFGIQHFENNHSSDLNQFYAYTIVNEEAQLAVFIDIKHKFMRDRESGQTIDVIIPYLLTSDGEMADDYFLSKFVIKESNSTYNSQMTLSTQLSNEPEVVEITINSPISAVEYTGVSSVSGLISRQLKSHVALGSGWAKLRGRAVILVNFNDGKLAAFFQTLRGSLAYSYLEGTAVDSNEKPIVISLTGASRSAGSSGGLTGSGSGSWTVFSGTSGGRAFVCASINRGSPVCRWIRI